MRRYQRIKRNPIRLILIGIAIIALILILFLPKGKNEETSQTGGDTETEVSFEDEEQGSEIKPPETDEAVETTAEPRESTVLDEENATGSMETAESTEATEPESAVVEQETTVGAIESSTDQTVEESSEQATSQPPGDASHGGVGPTGSTESSEPTEPIEPTESVDREEEIDYGTITCDRFAGFSGQFVEDGRDELVENVAAVLVTNRSDKFLNFAVLTYDIDGVPAVFVVSGLPAGASAWVMEYTRLTVTDSSVFTYEDSITSFRDTVLEATDKVTITADGNNLIATNNTSETLEDVYVYYKTVHTDGNFFGGITYRVDFGNLEPGVPVETVAGHYAEDSSRIIRISWRGSD